VRNIAIIDAGPFIALFDRSDKYHLKVRSFLEGFHGQLVTSWAVITEVTHMLDFHVHAQTDFLTWIQEGGVTIFDLGTGQGGRIIQLMEKYADLPMDLADATLVVIAEVMNIEKVISIDRDFSLYKIEGRKYFKNLFFNNLLA